MHSSFNDPLVTIVVTTKNEEAVIERCLKSIKYQSYKNIELIVVDNYSTDRTKEISLQYTELFYEKGPERSAQRNYGMIDRAAGYYVMYIDADMILAQGLVAACVMTLESKKYLALHIPEVVLGAGYFSRARRLERSFYDGTVIDGARIFVKDVFRRVGGFDQDLFLEGSGEDWDIDKSIKKIGSIGLLNSAIKFDTTIDWPLGDYIKKNYDQYNPNQTCIYHDESVFSTSEYLKKKRYYSKGFEGYKNKWGRSDPDIKKQFGIGYRYWGVFTENGKWRKIVGNFPEFFGVMYLKLLVGLIYLIGSKNK